MFNIFIGGWVDAFLACSGVSGIGVRGRGTRALILNTASTHPALLTLPCSTRRSIMPFCQVAIAFFVPALLIGFFIIMNLFIAILLEAFADDKEEGGGKVEDGETRGARECEHAQDEFAKAPKGTLETEPTAAAKEHAAVHEAAEDASLLSGESLGCLEERHPCRHVCHRLVSHPAFDLFILFVILASTICLALDVPRTHAGAQTH